MKSNIQSLKPQDVLVLLRLLFWREAEPWRFSDLAKDLRMSQSEVHQAIRRSQACDLYDPLTKRPKRASLTEFLIHGLRYVFPASVGGVISGLPTAHSAPPLSEQIVADSSDQYVWPSKRGKKKGYAVVPLYRTVPQLAAAFPELYQLLALIDALRVGRAREKELAKQKISELVAAA